MQYNNTNQSKLLTKLKELNFNGSLTVGLSQYMTYNGHILSIDKNGEYSIHQYRKSLNPQQEMISEEEWIS